jgi:hypothetical protein
MLNKTSIAGAMLIVGALLAICAGARLAAAQKSIPRTQDQLGLGEEDVRKLLLLIDTQRTGKISKQEWMNFMEAEFDRLDKDKSGVLDTRELAQSRLQVSPFATAGK